MSETSVKKSLTSVKNGHSSGKSSKFVKKTPQTSVKISQKITN